MTALVCCAVALFFVACAINVVSGAAAAFRERLIERSAQLAEYKEHARFMDATLKRAKRELADEAGLIGSVNARAMERELSQLPPYIPREAVMRDYGGGKLNY